MFSLCHWGGAYIHQSLSSSIGNLGQIVKIENLPLCVLLVQTLHIIHLSLTWNMSDFSFTSEMYWKTHFPWEVPFLQFFVCLFVFRCSILVLILLCVSSGDICDSTRKWIIKSPNCWRISIAAAFYQVPFNSSILAECTVYQLSQNFKSLQLHNENYVVLIFMWRGI